MTDFNDEMTKVKTDNTKTLSIVTPSTSASRQKDYRGRKSETHFYITAWVLKENREKARQILQTMG